MNAWIVSTAVSIIFLKGAIQVKNKASAKYIITTRAQSLTSLEADLYQDIYGDGEGSFYIWQMEHFLVAGTPMRWFLFVILLVWVNVVL